MLTNKERGFCWAIKLRLRVGYSLTLMTHWPDMMRWIFDFDSKLMCPLSLLRLIGLHEVSMSNIRRSYLMIKLRNFQVRNVANICFLLIKFEKRLFAQK